MNESILTNELQKKLNSQIEVIAEGINRYNIITPFQFDDGDHYVIILKKHRKQWMFTDEGHTFMHLSYVMDIKDLEAGTRNRILSNTCTMFGVENLEGQLILNVQDEQYGDALYTYLQALSKITDITFLSRERVRSTFLEDVRSIITREVPHDILYIDWNEPDKDPKQLYKSDYYIKSRANRKPVVVFALNNENKARDATIALLHYERWNLDINSIGIFEEQESLPGRVVARLTDVIGKTYSNIGEENERRITKQLQEAI